MDCPIIVGHRCNSIRTAILYRLLGVNAVEVDVRLGPGGEVIVGHGKPWIARPSPLGRAAAAIDYILFSRDPLIARRRRLAEWLPRLSWAELILLDLKDPIDPSALAREVEKGAPSASIAVSTPRHNMIQVIKRRLPGAEVLATIRDWIRDPAGYLKEIGADGASIPLPLVLEGYADELRNNGYLVYAWTLNKPEQVAAAASKVDAVITDAPWIARRALHRECHTRTAR